MSLMRALKAGEYYKIRRLRIWKEFLSEYANNPSQCLRVFSIHRKGFSVMDWETLSLNGDNYKKYLSSKQYNSVHPINGYYSKIIEDKLNIKYVFSGTALDKYMPRYYYLIDENGMCHPMMDLLESKAACGTKDIIVLLQKEQKLALKLVNGSIGKGFYKLEYREGKYLVNGEEYLEQRLSGLLSSCHNYVVIEYLSPHTDTARFCPDTANTIRYLTGCVDGEWRMIKCYVRLGTRKTGSIEAFNAGGVLCYADEAGRFKGGYQMERTGKHICTHVVDRHPDTGAELTGVIPCWDEIGKAAAGIEALLPQTKYLGLDFVVTDKSEVKLLEINSLTSLDTIQLDKSVWETENGSWFFGSLFK